MYVHVNVCACVHMHVHVHVHISVGKVIEIQTAITKDCGSEIYCACSSSIHKGTQKIWSDFNKVF